MLQVHSAPDVADDLMWCSQAADCAGKLFVFHTSLPIAEAPGKLKNREDKKLIGTDKEKLILPECMKLLPVYLNCVMKSDVLLPGADVSLDDRAYLRQLIGCMDVADTHVFFYPRLLPVVRQQTQSHKDLLTACCAVDVLGLKA
ncbi:hypothetical protein XENOCAPTIV_020278 [Xenoophorus captivus]|uniref:Sec23/Sec24 helical domain-containing protein n=1 Tax=Xenoophorus captivus TaxID=1517983 RepID=A0ABV0QD36_9TELE